MSINAKELNSRLWAEWKMGGLLKLEFKMLIVLLKDIGKRIISSLD